MVVLRTLKQFLLILLNRCYVLSYPCYSKIKCSLAQHIDNHSSLSFSTGSQIEVSLSKLTEMDGLSSNVIITSICA